AGRCDPDPRGVGRGMRVLIGAFGTRGDVQPMLALAHALEARGHSVTMAVPPSSLDHARASFSRCLAVGLNYEDFVRSVTHGSLRELRASLPVLRDQVTAQLEPLDALAAASDLVAGSSVF